MEDYFIAAVAQTKTIPFLAVRVVSEPYGEKLDTSPEYQALWLERYLRITTLLRDEFLLPFLQRL
jgi:nucleoside phosphorylase